MKKTNDSLTATNAKNLAELNSLKLQLAHPKDGNGPSRRKTAKIDPNQSLLNFPRLSNANSASGTGLITGSSNNTDNRMDTGATNDGWRTVTTKNQRKRANTTAGAARNGQKDKVTPIQLEKLNAMDLGALGTQLTTVVGDADSLFVQRFSEGKHPRIYCKSDATKAIVVDHLKSAKIQFNSYNNDGSRRKAFIVRGLCYESQQEAVDAIEKAIAAVGVCDSTISRFETAFMRHHPKTNRMPLYRVVVGSEVSDRLLVDICTIGIFGVRVEKMKKSAAIQCHNCQRFHHTTSQCHFNYRCVQCVTPHGFGECPRTNNKALPIGCVNCLDSKLNHAGHTANDHVNCSLFKKMVESGGTRLNKRVTTEAAGKPAATAKSSMRSTNVSAPVGSYANVLKASTSAVATGAIGGINADQLAKIIATTVQSVLSSLAGGS